MTKTIVIGIDAAVKEKNLGLCCLKTENNEILEVVFCNREIKDKDFFTKNITTWIENNKDCRILLAVDSPLGYPMNFGEKIKEHFAGAPLNFFESNDFPRRRTDEFIKEKFNITPLDISANLIARTTHSILNRISILKRINKLEDYFNLVWKSDFENSGMIEVYPKATLLSRINDKDLILSYKKDQSNTFDSLCEFYPLDNIALIDNINEHDFDAFICALAGFDFLNGDVCIDEKIPLEKLKVEGWIWTYNKKN